MRAENLPFFLVYVLGKQFSGGLLYSQKKKYKYIRSCKFHA